MIHFETKFPVRYYETDQMGVVHHSNYIRYFEVARNAMISEGGFPIEVCEKEFGVLIAIVSVECRFRVPSRMGDVLTVSADVDSVPMAKLKVLQKVVNQRGEVCAEGIVTLGFLNASNFRPTRCPEPLAELFENKLKQE